MILFYIFLYLEVCFCQNKRKCPLVTDILSFTLQSKKFYPILRCFFKEMQGGPKHFACNVYMKFCTDS